MPNNSSGDKSGKSPKVRHDKAAEFSASVGDSKTQRTAPPKAEVSRKPLGGKPSENKSSSEKR